MRKFFVVCHYEDEEDYFLDDGYDTLEEAKKAAKIKAKRYDVAITQTVLVGKAKMEWSAP